MTTTSATSASSGSNILSALSANNGIDTASLVSSLVSATYDPKTAAVTAKEATNTAKISSLATLSNGIDSFSTALTTLISSGTLSTQPTSSNTNVLTATAKAGAQIGSLSAQLSVRQVAQAQSLVSGYYASSTTAVGTGSFTIAVGGKNTTITLDSTNNTLAGLARAINSSGAGLTAAVVTDANGARLTLKGATGAANSFKITPGADADSTLSNLAYPANAATPAANAMTLAQGAQDALIRMDGVDITRSSNTIDDLIDGVTLKLVSASPTETVSLTATRPTDAIKQAVSDFVAAYNELKGQIDTATASSVTNADGTTSTGPLYNNSAIRQMQSMLSKLTSTKLNTAGGPATLAEIGVKTNRDGTLSLDDSTLATQLATYPDAVEAMFNPTQHASSPLIKITSAMGATKPGTYTLTNIVAQTADHNSSGTIAGVACLTTGSQLYAASASDASGLVIEPSGDIASATVTVDLGLGGALKAIRDTLRASNGVLSSLSSSLSTEKDDLADQMTKISTDSQTYKDRLTTQFSAMSTRVAAYKATQSYLEQQIAVWTKSDS